MALYLIRHPQPLVKPGICYGHSDLPLAVAVEPLLAGLRAVLPPSFQLHSSPLRRCAELAEALGEQVTYDTRLKEMDFGRWELQAWDSLGAATLDAWIAADYDASLHGGEAHSAFSCRVMNWLAAVPTERDTVAVTHAGVIRVLLARQHGWTLERALQRPLAFAEIVRFELPLKGEKP